MEVPRLEKIVINMGVGKATQQPSLLEGALRDLEQITGQKPIVTKARSSIAGFKLREGNAIGAKVTLRGDRMWEFFDRLVSLAIPRIRDFRGLPANVVRRPGQLHVRRHRAAHLPGDRLRQGRHHPRAWTSPSSPPPVPTPRAAPCSTPSASRSSVRGSKHAMAKKALKIKQQAKPKFKVRGYTRCQRCGRPQGGVPQVRAVPHLPARAGARRRGARRDQGELVRGGRTMTMTDPIADMLTRVRNANVAMHDTVPMPSLEAQGVPRRAARSARATSRASRVRDDPKRPGKILEIQMKYARRPRPDHLRPASGCPSPACGSTPAPSTCPACSAASASPCCPPAMG